MIEESKPLDYGGTTEICHEREGWGSIPEATSGLEPAAGPRREASNLFGAFSRAIPGAVDRHPIPVLITTNTQPDL